MNEFDAVVRNFANRANRKGRPFAKFPLPPDPHWLARAQALGKAQSRYLWTLLIVAAFYIALEAGTATKSEMTIPLLELDISRQIVLACGPLVLSFLILAAMGSLRAYSEACANLHQGANFDPEKYDVSPNAIDLAVYTTSRSPRLVVIAILFSYPLFFSFVLIEAASLIYEYVLIEATCLIYEMVCTARLSRFRIAFAVVDLILWVPATWLVLLMWMGRIRWVPRLWKRKNSKSKTRTHAL